MIVVIFAVFAQNKTNCEYAHMHNREHYENNIVTCLITTGSDPMSSNVPVTN